MKTISSLVVFGVMTSSGFAALDLPNEPRAVPTPAPAKAGHLPGTEALDELGVVLDLQDGSHIVGRITPHNMPVVIRSESIGEVKIPIDRVRGVQFIASNQQVVVTLQNGDKLQGIFAQESFKLGTVFGKVSIPTKFATRLAVSPARSGQVPVGCVLWYSFDADEGDRVTDKSGHDNHGRVQGARYVADGKMGGAMKFGEVHAAVRVGDSEALHLQDFTIAAWVKRDSKTRIAPDNPGGAIFGYGRGGYILVLDEDGRLLLSKNGLDFVRSGSVVQDTNYHHLVVTKAASVVIFYVDGLADSRLDYRTHFEFGNNAAVGAAPDDLTCSFLGVIDELMIYNRVLSPEEIKNLFDSQN